LSDCGFRKLHLWIGLARAYYGHDAFSRERNRRSSAKILRASWSNSLTSAPRRFLRAAHFAFAATSSKFFHLRRYGVSSRMWGDEVEALSRLITFRHRQTEIYAAADLSKNPLCDEARTRTRAVDSIRERLSLVGNGIREQRPRGSKLSAFISAPC